MSDLFRYVLRLGDLSLVLGQRLSEWVGHSPALEEDLGLANIALDLIGQARLLLSYAGEIEGRGRDEDKLAYMREQGAYFNAILAEQPNGDFGQTIVRQVLIDAFQLELYERLSASSEIGPPNRAGRLRPLSSIRVLTQLGHNTLTPIALPSSSAARTSDMPTLANLVAE